MRKSTILAMAAALCPPSAALAQTAFPEIQRIDPQPDPAAIPLPARKGASLKTEVWDLFGPANPVVRNVTQPTLTPVLPEQAKATGAAVIIAPGGGFLALSMQTEGFAVARKLADQGIAAFVLKYRLQATPVDEKAFAATMMQRYASAPKGGSPAQALAALVPEPTEDALAALRLVRRRAAEWRIDTDRVGLMGFSAGAMTAMELVRTVPSNEMPAFIGFIYGPQTAIAVPASAPPLFNAIAFDDTLFATGDFPIAAAWRRAGRKVELHAYQEGGHGFGGLGKPGTTTTSLLDQFTSWLTMLGLLGQAK